MSTPIHRVRSGFCASATNGQASVAPPSKLTNSRRLMQSAILSSPKEEPVRASKGGLYYFMVCRAPTKCPVVGKRDVRFESEIEGDTGQALTTELDCGFTPWIRICGCAVSAASALAPAAATSDIPPSLRDLPDLTAMCS